MEWRNVKIVGSKQGCMHRPGVEQHSTARENLVGRVVKTST